MRSSMSVPVLSERTQNAPVPHTTSGIVWPDPLTSGGWLLTTLITCTVGDGSQMSVDAVVKPSVNEYSTILCIGGHMHSGSMAASRVGGVVSTTVADVSVNDTC